MADVLQGVRPVSVRRRPLRAAAWGSLVVVAIVAAVAVEVFGGGAAPPLPCRARSGVFFGPRPADAVLRPLAQVCVLLGRLARSEGGSGWAADLERLARRSDSSVVISGAPLARARSLGASVPIVDSARSDRRRIVAYLRAADGRVWQMTKALGGAPTFALAGTYDAEVLADAPLGYWPLSDGSGSRVADASGFGRDAAYTGQVRRGSPGPGGFAQRSALFAGHGHISLALAGVPRATGATTTVELWLAPDAFPPGSEFQMPFGFRYYALFLGRRALGFNTGNGDLWGARVPRLDRGWHYVVALFRNGRVRGNELYLDGRRLGLSQVHSPQTPGSSVPQDVSPSAQISGWPSDPHDNFYGGVAAVAVYPHALSAAQVAAHFRAATGRS